MKYGNNTHNIAFIIQFTRKNPFWGRGAGWGVMFLVEKKILSDFLTLEKCSGLLNAVTKILTGEISKNILK